MRLPLQLQMVHLYVGDDHEVDAQNCAMHPVAHPMLHTLVRTSRSYAIDTANSSQHRFLASAQPGCMVGQDDTPGQETCTSMHACMAEYNAKHQLTIACRVALKACLHNLAFLSAVAIASLRMFTHGVGQLSN